jgi:TRAP-type C4-dicarboxylate transport system permease small subunit
VSRLTSAWRSGQWRIEALDPERVLRRGEKGSRPTPLTSRPRGSLQASFAALHWAEDTIGVLLFGATLVVVLMQVFVRFLLYRWLQIAWADEIGRALLVWSSFWGAVLVTRESHHITVDLLYDRLPPGARRIVRTAADGVVGVFLVIVLWKGSPIFLDSLSRPSPATNLPAFIFDGALAISSALMIFHVAVNAVQLWRPDPTRDSLESARGDLS